jgi:hypothetical protein
MKLIPLLLVCLVVAACGAAREEANVPGSSGEDSTTSLEPPKTVMTESDNPELKPPQIVLLSETGRQPVVQGSYCMTGEGQGVCADAAGHLVPKAVTVVVRGDSVKVEVPRTTLRGGSRIIVRPLGCFDREVKALDLPASGELEWPVDLDPGAYQLDVFVMFKTDDGLTGDSSGTLGLVVGGAKSGDALGVLRMERSMMVCAFID